MIVYSKKIILFINEIKRTVKEVLSKEVGLKVVGDRFYDRRQEFSYPIKVVIYNNKSLLGYYEPHFYELGFHESLMHSYRQQLHHIIRHEIAHYITVINFGEGIQSHGPEFRAFCQRMGWGEEIYKATSSLAEGRNVCDLEESNIYRKVQKLMALSTSSNRHEAEQAMIKSQQLLLKHNIDSNYFGCEDEEKVFIKRIMKQKKENAKMRCIAKILETFFVNIIYKRAGEFTYLEILGNTVNIEIAEYVAGVLQLELDKLWHQAQRYANLRGAVAKNSFLLGIARGYCIKIQALKREYNHDVAHALMVIEKKLIDAKEMVYPRLSTSKSYAKHCRESSAIGELMGKQLTINPAIKSSSSTSEIQIGYSG